MSKHWKLEKSNHHFPELHKKNKLLKVLVKALTPTKITVCMALFIAVGGWMYLSLTNVGATSGYKINELNKQVETLKDKNIQLNMEYAKLQSIAAITDKVSEFDLVAADDVEVINAGASAVAMK